MLKISEHITYAEAIRSDTAKRLGIDNTPNEEQLKNMESVAVNVFEPLRDNFCVPIYIPSFFRSKLLNKAIAGSTNSQHMNGEAIDLDADMFGIITNKQIFDYIKDHLKFDQLIAEDVKPDGKIEWVHVSYKDTGNRNEILTMTIVNGKKHYEIYK